MSELEEIAESVAKGLDLDAAPFGGRYWRHKKEMSAVLRRDGKNLFNEDWFHRCLGYLFSLGLKFEQFDSDGGMMFKPVQGTWKSESDVILNCPWQEFPARAIHHLMTKK